MDKRKIIKICIATVIFICAICLKISNEGIKIALFIIAYLILGFDVIKEAIANIVHGEFFDETFLMTVATIGAIAIKQYPEAVAVMLFYQLGELFEDAAVDKSKESITSLLKIRPDYANILDKSGKLVQRNPSEISLGDIIIIKPGEKVPLDGVIIEGESTVDTSALTGEPMPKNVAIGENIYSGCINLTGKLTVKVLKEFGESTVNKIINLVQNATEKKTETENFITKFSKIYTPIVVSLAVIIAIIPPFMMGAGNFEMWIYRSLTFLVISCPCALVISVPLSFFGGIGGASKSGILVKGSNYLETLANLKTVIFDKTGTLTKGDFKVQEIVPNEVSRDELLKVTAYAENASTHPIAKSIMNIYKGAVDVSKISEINETSGKGVTCKIQRSLFEKNILERIKNESQYIENKDISNAINNNEDKEQVALTVYSVVVGKAEFLKENGIQDFENNDLKIGTTLFVAVDGKYIGKIVIADEIKSDSAKAIKALKILGVTKTIMLTGDKKEVGEYVARKIGIDDVYSELLPNEKVNKLEEILKINYRTGGYLAFVGDGINDAPSLARADIGIAMGGLGSDVAIEAADVVIMTDEPSKIAKAIKISQKTIKIARENIIFAIAVKILVLILSIIGLATMWEAVFADVGVTIIAVLNSIRALKK